MVARRAEPLHDAVYAGDHEALRRLLAEGHDPDGRDGDRSTALHLAARMGDAEAATILLDGGATVDPRDVHGNTPLFRAVYQYDGDGTLFMLLRARGADPHAMNTAGQTPVGLARLIANRDVRRFFLDVEGEGVPAGGQAPEATVRRGSCYVSKHVTFRHEPVGYMYREEPDAAGDSGWRFFSGRETDDEVEDPLAFELQTVEEVARIDPDIVPWLDAPAGSAFIRETLGAPLLPDPSPAG
jgi:hypothetical protein